MPQDPARSFSDQRRRVAGGKRWKGREGEADRNGTCNHRGVMRACVQTNPCSRLDTRGDRRFADSRTAGSKREVPAVSWTIILHYR